MVTLILGGCQLKFSDELPFAKYQGACFFGGGDHKSLRHSPACAAGLKGFQLCSNVGGHYRTPTQRMHQLFYGKSLKITIKLHCLILPQMGNLMTPVQFWGCLSFSKKLPARASILQKKKQQQQQPLHPGLQFSMQHYRSPRLPFQLQR